MKCKICNEEITPRKAAMHFKWKHDGLKTKDYIKKHGEFRSKKINEDYLKQDSNFECKICNQKMINNRQLMYHITKNHKNISKEEYIIKYFLNGVAPTCKCGCGENVKILPNGKNNQYHNEYIKGHWDWVKPGHLIHSETTKKQMRISAIKRIENEKGLFKGVSKLEQELVEFIKNIYKKTIILNDNIILSGKELDIYLPDVKIAIEFNGTYYHSDLYKDKNYHLNKTKECNDLGIKLIHIWDSDWIYNNDIIKSILINQLSKTPNKIYARKCNIKEITKKESVLFLKTNHLQGNAICKYSLGLYYDDELVSVMTFGKLRKNLKQTHIEGHYELIRFCNKLNTNVIGGASKLFKHFINKYNPYKIISFANRDWSDGKLYNQLNMTQLKPTPPGYNWFKSKIKYNRFNFRKDILVSQGENKLLTEYEIMLNKGYYRVWNTGNLKFEWNK